MEDGLLVARRSGCKELPGSRVALEKAKLIALQIEDAFLGVNRME
jgi:hypothetical protein